MNLKNIIILVIAIIFLACSSDKKKEEKKIDIKNNEPVQELPEFAVINNKIKQNINDPALYLERAKLYANKNDLRSALFDVDRALTIDSLIPEIYLLKAELLKKQGKLIASKEALDKCLLIDNKNIPARLELGWLALVAQDYKQSISYADAVLKIDVFNPKAYYLKGINFIEIGDTNKAISSLRTAVEQNNNYYDAYIQLGVLHYLKKDPLAKDYYLNAIRIKPKSIEALYNYALYCQENADYNNAQQTYIKILEIDKGFYQAHFNMGYIHQEYLNVYNIAIEHYTKAIGVAPNYYEAYYNRGLCYEALGDVIKAEADYRKALNIRPDYNYAALALERVLKSN